MSALSPATPAMQQEMKKAAFAALVAPRVGKPQCPELRILVEYDLGGYYRPSVPVGTVSLMGGVYNSRPP
jgi:hypothetical protein